MKTSILKQSLTEETDHCDLSKYFSSLGVPPVKVHTRLQTSKVKAVKRKLDAAATAFHEKVARTLNVPICTSVRRSTKTANWAHREGWGLWANDSTASWKDPNGLKFKFWHCPLNWSIRSVSEHAVRTARRVIKETVLDLENHFYQYDEFSTVSVGRNNHVQKNLFAIWRTSYCI